MNVAEGIKTRWKLEQLRVDFDDDPNDVLLEGTNKSSSPI